MFDARIPCLTNAIGVSNQETILLPYWQLDRCYIIVRPVVLVCHCVSPVFVCIGKTHIGQFQLIF